MGFRATGRVTFGGTTKIALGEVIGSWGDTFLSRWRWPGDALWAEKTGAVKGRGVNQAARQAKQSREAGERGVTGAGRRQAGTQSCQEGDPLSFQPGAGGSGSLHKRPSPSVLPSSAGRCSETHSPGVRETQK